MWLYHELGHYEDKYHLDYSSLIWHPALYLLTIFIVLATISISNNNTVLNKVIADIWEHDNLARQMMSKPVVPASYLNAFFQMLKLAKVDLKYRSIIAQELCTYTTIASQTRKSSVTDVYNQRFRVSHIGIKLRCNLIYFHLHLSTYASPLATSQI